MTTARSLAFALIRPNPCRMLGLMLGLAIGVNPSRHFHSSLGVIRLVALMCVQFPLPLRKVEYLLFAADSLF